jgi:hypothetical protein
MMNDECGMMNEKQAALVKFIIHHSVFIICLYVAS